MFVIQRNKTIAKSVKNKASPKKRLSQIQIKARTAAVSEDEIVIELEYWHLFDPFRYTNYSKFASWHYN